MSSDDSTSTRSSLHDTIVTLPLAAIGTLAVKRYFAEDITIAIGVIFSEWRASGLAPEDT